MLLLSLKNIKFLFLSFIALILSGKLFSQGIEFPEDKVKYSINVVQKECVVSIIA